MEKFIELLNEYDKIKWDKEEPIYNWKIAIKTKIYQTYIISARYGFIKWLVENDKIDRDKNVLAFEFSSVYTYDGEDYEDHLKECKLLMLLAIQDEPIRFLCEIIK